MCKPGTSINLLRRKLDILMPKIPSINRILRWPRPKEVAACKRQKRDYRQPLVKTKETNEKRRKTQRFACPFRLQTLKKRKPRTHLSDKYIYIYISATNARKNKYRCCDFIFFHFDEFLPRVPFLDLVKRVGNFLPTTQFGCFPCLAD
jgi:hypothetical protein